MNAPLPSRRRLPGAPKCSRQGGFTLVEIMIVVLIVTILSGLALAAIGRIKDKAARTLIANNLRQIYDAKEYYYSETGSTQIASFKTLINKGYLRSSMSEIIAATHTLEGNLGWRYAFIYRPDAPVYAFRGEDPLVARPDHLFDWRKTNGEVLWYPAPPQGALSNNDSTTNPVTPPSLTPRPPVIVPQPPVAQPPVVVAQPSIPTTTINPDIPQPPALVAQPPAVIAQPPITTTVNPPDSQTPSTTDSSSTANNSPGNSAFGHSHNQGKQGNSGQGHGNNKP